MSGSSWVASRYQRRPSAAFSTNSGEIASGPGLLLLARLVPLALAVFVDLAPDPLGHMQVAFFRLFDRVLEARITAHNSRSACMNLNRSICFGVSSGCLRRRASLICWTLAVCRGSDGKKTAWIPLNPITATKTRTVRRSVWVSSARTSRSLRSYPRWWRGSRRRSCGRCRTASCAVPEFNSRRAGAFLIRSWAASDG